MLEATYAVNRLCMGVALPLLLAAGGVFAVDIKAAKCVFTDGTVLTPALN